jgi:hypothetical protein
MIIEICSHCYKYSKLLSFQLSSFILFPPKNTYIYTLFFSQKDKNTQDVIDFFKPKLEGVIELNLKPIEEGLLFNRGAGRNIALHESKANWIWFTDVDFLFRHNCLNDLTSILEYENHNLVHPTFIKQNKSTEDGDIVIESVKDISVIDIEEKDYIDHKINRAIGAVQIANVEKTKYLNYCNYLGTYKTWHRCSSDIKFRKQIDSKGKIEIDGIFRIRHTKKGRLQQIEI